MYVEIDVRLAVARYDVFESDWSTGAMGLQCVTRDHRTAPCTRFFAKMSNSEFVVVMDMVTDC